MKRTTMELDHLVLEVRDAERSARFYDDVLGLAPVRLDEFRAGAAKFPSVRVGGETILDLFPPAMWRGAAAHNPNHVCLATSEESFRAIEAQLAARGIAVTKRDEHNFGARGFASSVYFDDPDGVSVEVRWYPEARRA